MLLIPRCGLRLAHRVVEESNALVLDFLHRHPTEIGKSRFAVYALAGQLKDRSSFIQCRYGVFENLADLGQTLNQFIVIG